MHVLFNFASFFSPLCRHSLIKTGLLSVIHFLIGWECHLSLELAMCLSSYLGSLQLAISHHHPCASHQEPLRCNLQLHLTRITPTTILPFFCRLVPYFRFRFKWIVDMIYVYNRILWSQLIYVAISQPHQVVKRLLLLFIEYFYASFNRQSSL